MKLGPAAILSLKDVKSTAEDDDDGCGPAEGLVASADAASGELVLGCRLALQVEMEEATKR